MVFSESENFKFCYSLIVWDLNVKNFYQTLENLIFSVNDR